MAEPIPRRRRRSRRELDAEPRTGTPADFATTDAPEPPDHEEEVASERGLRGLIGGGSSQVNVGAALRARDAARPTAADIAAAETDLVIIRRGWIPPSEPR